MLTSASTDAEVIAAYEDNASWEESGSATKAAAFVTACRFMVQRFPRMTSVDGVSSTWDLNLIRAEMERARRYVASARSGSGSVRYLDLSGSRD